MEIKNQIFYDDTQLEWHYTEDCDEVRAARAWKLLTPLHGRIRRVYTQGGDYLRACWCGNYLHLGTPMFHHPLLIPWKKEIKEGLQLYKDFFMGEKNQSILNNLPNELTIYRGDNKSISGYSWTLDEKYAEVFGKVNKRIISKKDIFAYVDDRDEKEIIVLD